MTGVVVVVWGESSFKLLSILTIHAPQNIIMAAILVKSRGGLEAFHQNHKVLPSG